MFRVRASLHAPAYVPGTYAVLCAPACMRLPAQPYLPFFCLSARRAHYTLQLIYKHFGPRLKPLLRKFHTDGINFLVSGHDSAIIRAGIGRLPCMEPELQVCSDLSFSFSLCTHVWSAGRAPREGGISHACPARASPADAGCRSSRSWAGKRG